MPGLRGLRREQLRKALVHSGERHQWLADVMAVAVNEARRALAVAEALCPLIDAGVGGAVLRAYQRAAALAYTIATGFQGLRTAAQQLLDVVRAVQGPAPLHKENNALLDGWNPRTWS